MAALSIGYGVVSVSPKFVFTNSSSLNLPNQILLSKIQFIKPSYQNSRSVLPPISAIQSNFFKVAQTVFKIGKDGVEAGTNLVPETVPRPVAKLSVTVVATTLSLFVLKSFFSAVFFALGVMGFVYFVYLALNKDKGPKLDENPGSTDDAIDQANKIMEKYK